MPGEPFMKHLLEEAECEVWQDETDPEDSYRWTYMFNDSVESYIWLEGVSITGEYRKEEACLELHLQQAEQRMGISGRHQSGMAFCIWFDRATFRAKLYSYHEIGHFWVKGAEPWRQLVYELGIIEDKREYLSEAMACSAQERALLPLLEYAPVRSYYSVPWDEGEIFSTSEEGKKAFLQLCKETEDVAHTDWEKQCCRKIQQMYLNDSDVVDRDKDKQMERLLGTQYGLILYQALRSRIIEASAGYGERNFGEGKNGRIQECKKEIEKKYHRLGWKGSYPDYYRRSGLWYEQIHVVEEQPFTTDAIKYCFHGMVSRCARFRYGKLRKKFGVDEEGRLPVNFGFFRGCGKGKIVTVHRIDKL